MDRHFCTCTATSCKNHPQNHTEGCDLCIKKNLKHGEIPSCFWRQISDDLSGCKSYTYADFADFFHQHQADYEKIKADAKSNP